MKKFLFLFALTFSTVLITACSSSATPAASIIEEGETNVAPHDDSDQPPHRD